VSQRIQIVLPDPTAAQLRELAAASGQPAATLASQMVRSELADAATSGKVRSVRSTQANVGGSPGERARWLEPYGGSSAWRAAMWGAIVALHGRYPRALGHLKDGWWTDESHTETLCALVVWRGDVDDSGKDPREELAFHTQLGDYARALRAEGGGVERAWQPGAPPAEWPDR
jgi:hypothetical protein